MTICNKRVQLIDCGLASKRTRGFANMIAYEGGFPPFDKTYFPWG